MMEGASNAVWDNKKGMRKYNVQCIHPADGTANSCKYGVTVTVKIVDFLPHIFTSIC